MTNDKRIIGIEVGKACIGGLLDTMTGSVILTANEVKEVESYIDQLNVENAKLREQVMRLQIDWESERDYANQMEAKEKKAVDENDKLRELVADMWFWGYEGYMDRESQEWQMKHIDEVLDRMRELGIKI